MLKYPQLFSLVKAVLSISHGSASPDSGFSINKSILDTHGNSLDPDTIQALRIVTIKDGNYLNVDVTKKLLHSVKNSHIRYKADLEEKKRLELARREKQRKESDEKDKAIQGNKRRDKINEICRDIDLKKKSISVAEEIIEEGNKELQICLQKKPLSRDEFRRAESKIEISLKRKKKLEVEILLLTNKRTKLSA